MELINYISKEYEEISSIILNKLGTNPKDNILKPNDLFNYYVFYLFFSVNQKTDFFYVNHIFKNEVYLYGYSTFNEYKLKEYQFLYKMNSKNMNIDLDKIETFEFLPESNFERYSNGVKVNTNKGYLTLFDFYDIVFLYDHIGEIIVIDYLRENYTAIYGLKSNSKMLSIIENIDKAITPLVYSGNSLGTDLLDKIAMDNFI